MIRTSRELWNICTLYYWSESEKFISHNDIRILRADLVRSDRLHVLGNVTIRRCELWILFLWCCVCEIHTAVEGSQIWRKGSGYSRYQLRLDFFLSVVLPEFEIFWQDCRSIPNSKENPPKLSVCSHWPGHSQVLTTLTTGRWRHT